MTTEELILRAAEDCSAANLKVLLNDLHSQANRDLNEFAEQLQLLWDNFPEELELEQENGAEMVSFGIIANAGDARSYAFGALEAAKAGNFEEAEELLKKSNDAAVEAHHMQTELLVNEANGNKTPVDVLLVHAQDHLMTSMLAVELIKELITIYKNK